MPLHPDLNRHRGSRVVLSLLGVLAACAWSVTLPASGKKSRAEPEIVEQAVPVEPPGVYQTPEGFRVVEAALADEATRAEYARALVLLEQERFAEGAAILTRITEQVPGLVPAHVDLGIALRRAGELEAAAASLQRALELNPQHPVALNELGMVQRLLWQFAEARASYEKALAIAPDFHFAQLNLAIVCDLYLSDESCALKNYLAYQQAVPDDRQAGIWIADLRTRSGLQE